MTKGRPNQEQYAPVSTDELLAESAPDRSLRPVDPARSNTRIALVNFFKGLFGAGVLAIPNAFESSGLPLGVAVFLLVAAVCVGTMLILLDCQRIVRERKGIEAGTYEELAGAVFGPVAFHAVQIVMALLTIIFCTGFVIVISNSLADTFPGVSRPGWCLLVFPLLTILSWIPFMKDLWATSILGLAVYLVGVVGATFYHGATNWNPPSHAMDFRWAGVMHFYGTAVYTLEGINLTLPIASSMKSRTKQSLVMIIGLSAFALITVSYSAFAFAAGDGGCDIVTKCMGHGRLTDVVKMALCVSLLATHPVYLIVASKIFERACLGDEPPPPPLLPPPQPSNSSNSSSLNLAHQRYVATAAAAEVRWNRGGEEGGRQGGFGGVDGTRLDSVSPALTVQSGALETGRTTSQEQSMRKAWDVSPKMDTNKFINACVNHRDVPPRRRGLSAPQTGCSVSLCHSQYAVSARVIRTVEIESP